MAKLGAKAVPKGRITDKQVERLERWEACQQNAVENYPLFVAAVVCALVFVTFLC